MTNCTSFRGDLIAGSELSRHLLARPSQKVVYRLHYVWIIWITCIRTYDSMRHVENIMGFRERLL